MVKNSISSNMNKKLTPNSIISKHAPATDTSLNDFISKSSNNTDLNDLIKLENMREHAERNVKSNIGGEKKDQSKQKKINSSSKQKDSARPADICAENNIKELNVSYKNDLTINTDLNDLVDMCTSDCNTSLNEIITPDENHYYSNSGIHDNFCN